MASQRQIAANRLNAQGSTGPRTEAGKAASSRNALTHALTARKVLVAGEDPQEYRWLRQGVIHDYRPATTLERELVEQIVSVLWRMRRVPVVEAALTAWLKAVERESDRRYPKLAPVKDMTDKLWLGRTAQELLSSGLMDRLNRHATGLQRQLSALVKELRALQAHRHDAAQREKGQASPPTPLAAAPVPLPAAFGVVAGSEANGSPSTAVKQAKP